MKPRLSDMWWLVAAGAALLLASVVSREVQIGSVSLSRNNPGSLVVLFATGVLAVALLGAVFFALHGHRVAVAICKWWGALYSIIVLPLLFVLLSYRELGSILVMAAFSAAWYWWASRAVAAGAQLGAQADGPASGGPAA